MYYISDAMEAIRYASSLVKSQGKEYVVAVDNDKLVVCEQVHLPAHAYIVERIYPT